MFSVPELCVREKMDRDSGEDSINDAMEVTGTEGEDVMDENGMDVMDWRVGTVGSGEQCGEWGAVSRPGSTEQCGDFPNKFFITIVFPISIHKSIVKKLIVYFST